MHALVFSESEVVYSTNKLVNCKMSIKKKTSGLKKQVRKRKSKYPTTPRRWKFPKWHKFLVKNLNYSKNGCELLYGTLGLRILKPVRLYWNQIEAARQKITRMLRKYNILYIRMFPNIPITKKPKEIRMGKGKGSVDHYLIRAEAGRILFELTGFVFEKRARDLLMVASRRLPTPCAVIGISKS